MHIHTWRLGSVEYVGSAQYLVQVEYMLDTSKRYGVFASVLHPEIELPTRWTPRALLPT